MRSQPEPRTHQKHPEGFSASSKCRMRGARLAALVLIGSALALLGSASLPIAASAKPSGCARLDPALEWYGDSLERLQALIDTRGRCSSGAGFRPPLAVFDWDNTVIKNDVGDAQMFWMLRNGRIRQPAGQDWRATSPYLTDAAAAALGAACGTAVPAGERLPTGTDSDCADEILSVYGSAATTGGAAAFAGWNRRRLEPTYAWLAQLLAGWNQRQVQDFAAAARKENLAAPVGATQTVGSRQVTGYVRYYAQMRDLIATMRRSGFDVWVVSASPQWVVETWADEVGVDEDHVIGIRSVTGAGGRATHDLQGCGDVPDGADSVITYIDGKRCWINQQVLGITGAAAFEQAPAARRQVFGAGDSNTDVTMVRDATALRLVINRNRAELMCHAYWNADGNWLINPMFVLPRPKAASYPCSTTAVEDETGARGPAIDDDGTVIPDQEDTVHG
jgi:hypothetical protein